LGPAEARLVASAPARPEELSLAAELGISDHVEFRPRAPYGKTLQALKQADVLVLSNDDDAPVVPSKLYDYLAARRPILSLSAEPESNQIVMATNSGLAPGTNDPEAVADAIATLRERTRASDWGALPEGRVHDFTAQVQAERFAVVLEELAGR
jgi:glycosyltransferase involved in cell wall biosynthesis